MRRGPETNPTDQLNFLRRRLVHRQCLSFLLWICRSGRFTGRLVFLLDVDPFSFNVNSFFIFRLPAGQNKPVDIVYLSEFSAPFLCLPSQFLVVLTVGQFFLLKK